MDLRINYEKQRIEITFPPDATGSTPVVFPLKFSATIAELVDVVHIMKGYPYINDPPPPASEIFGSDSEDEEF